jgi:tagatose-1,6-bisphosphate aldolase
VLERLARYILDEDFYEIAAQKLAYLNEYCELCVAQILQLISCRV